MRTILYRGKSTNTGEWVYGFYVNKGGKKHQIVTNNDTFPKEVMIESVGQLTGLKDKTGNDIYEGDIVKVDKKGIYEEGIGLFVWQEWEEGINFHGEKEWMKKRAGWHLQTKCRQIWTSESIEIIGNIYDNPELLTT